MTDHPRGYSPAITLRGPFSDRVVDRGGLLALPAVTIESRFLVGGDPRERAFRGTSLWDLIATCQPAFDQPVDALRHAILVTSIDGHAAAFSWGEIDPEYLGRTVLVAYDEAGTPLGHSGGIARLVVPDDANAGRYVTAIASIAVRRL